jgi:putative chitinase
MTLDELCAATGAHSSDAAKLLPYLDAAFAEFEINTVVRQAAFLAQIGHESGGLHWLREIWGPTPTQERYEGRADLGNTESGDGSRYRGRGYIQLTGRANYARAGAALALDLVDQPQLLEAPQTAIRTAAWFWKEHGLNELADNDEFEKITRKINGGLNGYTQRCALWESAKEVLA